MSGSEEIQQQIEKATDLSAGKNFRESLSIYTALLNQVEDKQIRGRILYGIITCATWLQLDDLLKNAIIELENLPGDKEIVHAFVLMTEAWALDDFGKPQEAIERIDENLKSSVLRRDDFQDWRYDHVFMRGRCLVQLKRYIEALQMFDTARKLDPEGEHETDMLIERANCFLALSRYEEAYIAARQVLKRDDGDMATLAMQYMAECRLWQDQVREALEIYAALQKRLPSKLVNEERIQTGIRNAMTYLERGQTPSLPC